jgi:hypothetical protein
MDAGYDRGGIFGNSTWNAYSKKNVMGYVDGDGGLSAPIGRPVLRSGVIRKFVSHASVETLYLDHSASDRVAVLKGSVVLRLGPHRSLYDRTVLFIADPRMPYVVDVNRVRKMAESLYDEEYRMRYYVDGARFTGHAPGRPWDRWSQGRSNRAFMYLRPVEYSNDRYASETNGVWVRERFGKANEKKVRRLSLYGPRAPAMSTMGVLVSRAKQPRSAPVPLADMGAESVRTHQVWYWANVDADAIDVIFVRSPVFPGAHGEAVQIQVPLPGEGAVTLVARPHLGVGFTRLVHVEGRWQLAEDFQYGLVCQPGRPDA